VANDGIRCYAGSRWSARAATRWARPAWSASSRTPSAPPTWQSSARSRTRRCAGSRSGGRARSP